MSVTETGTNYCQGIGIRLRRNQSYIEPIFSLVQKIKQQ